MLLSVDCSVCGALGEALLLWGHVGVLVGIAAAIFARKQFVPYACCGIATIDVVEVVSISTEGIAKLGLTRERDGFSTGDEHQFGVA